jgi:hypothetical protein
MSWETAADAFLREETGSSAQTRHALGKIRKTDRVESGRLIARIPTKGPCAY